MARIIPFSCKTDDSFVTTYAMGDDTWRRIVELTQPSCPKARLVCRRWRAWCAAFGRGYEVRRIFERVLQGDASRMSFEASYFAVYKMRLETRVSDVLFLLRRSCHRTRLRWHDAIVAASLLEDLCLSVRDVVETRSMSLRHVIRCSLRVTGQSVSLRRRATRQRHQRNSVREVHRPPQKGASTFRV